MQGTIITPPTIYRSRAAAQHAARTLELYDIDINGDDARHWVPTRHDSDTWVIELYADPDHTIPVATW